MNGYNYSAWVNPKMLATPTGIRVTATTSDSVSLAWSPVTGATGYDVQWCETGTANWKTTNVTIAGATAVVSGLDLAPDKGYEFRLRATNENYYDYSAWATPEIISTSHFCCTAKTDRSVSLAWSPIAGATGYEVQWRKTGDTEWSTTNVTIAGTTAVVSNLVPGARYEFRLRATNYKSYSNSEGWNTLIYIPDITILPLSIPENFRSTAKTSDSISLIWLPVTYATGYDVEWREIGAKKWETKNVTITGTEAVVFGLDPNTRYEFQLRAIGRNDNNSRWTTPPLPERTLLQTPADFTAKMKISAVPQVFLGWSSVKDATGYEVQWRKTGDAKWSTANVTFTGHWSAVISGLSRTRYEFRLRTIFRTINSNNNNDSEWTTLTFNDHDWQRVESQGLLGCDPTWTTIDGELRLTIIDVSRKYSSGSLDLSGCTALKWLDCSYNQLTSLNVSGCTALKWLYCSYNQLTSLDVSGCTALEWLDYNSNQMTSLDVSSNTTLEYLFCYNNQLPSLNVSDLTDLKWLDCFSNPLESLNVPGLSLTRLNCLPPPIMISGPLPQDKLHEKSLTYWEFWTDSPSNPIRDWEVNWGDGSQLTLILGGPRNRINVEHFFRKPGTYTITVSTTDFFGISMTATIGTYMVKARRTAKPAPEFTFQEEPPAVTIAASPLPNESRMEFVEENTTETMRLRQMLDLDQRNFGQQSNRVTDAIFADDELFEDEWFDFSEERSDFWNDVFENELLSLKSGF